MNPKIIRLWAVIIVASSLLLLGFLSSFNVVVGAINKQDDSWRLKVEPEVLAALDSSENTDIRVHFLAKPDLSTAEQLDWSARGWFVYQSLQVAATQSQQSAVTYLEGRGMRYQSFFTGNDVYVWKADYDALRNLASLPEVSKIYAPRGYTINGFLNSPDLKNGYIAPVELVSNRLYYAVQDPGDQVPEALEWAVSDVKADQFWNTFGSQGEGIVVANIDTGVQWDHPALINAYRCQDDPGNPACWWDPSNICGGEPCDNVPHGTPMTGSMVGDDNELLPHQVGVAPEAQWIACKGCESTSCSEYALISCAEWVIAPGGNPDNRPHLVNSGWGGPGCDDWFMPYINSWLAAGIAPVFSPGGSGPSCNTLGSPGDYLQVFTPTAHDQNRLVASFASRGPSCFGEDAKPNISAPGVNLWLPVPTDGWQNYNGTSFSSAYGAGSLALLMSCAPGLWGNVQGLFDALQSTSDEPPAGNCGAPPDGNGNYTYGHGYVNLFAAGQAFCEDFSTGYLEGHVYDALSSDPLEWASVLAEKWENDWQAITTTNSTGYYTMTLRSGIYTVTVEHPHYTPVITTGIEIITDQVTTLDLYLMPKATLYGFVTDSENGSALDATVRANGEMTVTHPATGYYELLLDEGYYDVSASAPDYITQTASISLTGGIAIQLDFELVPVTLPVSPTASFTSNSPVYLGATAVFTNTSDLGNPPDATFYWDFGDTMTSTLENPEHLYQHTGLYTVTLEACNPVGCDEVQGSFEVIDELLVDLSVDKLDLLDPVHPGEPITYRITVQNFGPDDGLNLLLTDTPEFNFSLFSASEGCSLLNELITCTYSELTAGDAMTIVIILQPQDEMQHYVNHVEITSEGVELLPENNFDTEITEVQSDSGYTIHIPLVTNH